MTHLATHAVIDRPSSVRGRLDTVSPSARDGLQAFVVRSADGANRYTWEIRRLDYYLILQGETAFATPAQALAAGEEALLHLRMYRAHEARLAPPLACASESRGRSRLSRPAGLSASRSACGRKIAGFRGANLDQARALSAALRREKATSHSCELAPVIEDLRRNGITTLRAMAEALSKRGIPTARGKAVWSPMQVSRVLKWLETAEHA